MNGSSITSAHMRRGALFLVNIGVPLVVGVWRGEPVAALLGAVVARPPLWSRCAVMLSVRNCVERSRTQSGGRANGEAARSQDPRP